MLISSHLVLHHSRCSGAETHAHHLILLCLPILVSGIPGIKPQSSPATFETSHHPLVSGWLLTQSKMAWGVEVSAGGVGDRVRREGVCACTRLNMVTD